MKLKRINLIQGRKGVTSVTEKELLKKLNAITKDTLVNRLIGTMYGACIVAARTGKANAFRAPPEFNWPDIDGSDPNHRALTRTDELEAIRRTMRRGVSEDTIVKFGMNAKRWRLSKAEIVDRLDDLKPGEPA